MAGDTKAREIINYSFLVALSDDGVIDEGELAYIKSLALADGVLDEKERDSLRRVFSHVDVDKLSPHARQEFRDFCERYQIK
ncbi:MAG: hypothetical protein AAF699_09540 [Pseudomonadota bacterium]